MSAPTLALDHLDDLWFQVAGTRCNLTCHHCFISCSPKNHTFGFLSLEQVRAALLESVAIGVKEYYFTGGEPFLNPDIVPMLKLSLEFGPTTVLTNATVLRDSWLDELRVAEGAGPFSLEFRVSIDGYSPATNDPIRGAGTFDRAMRGVEQLVAHGFLPVITAARTWEDHEEPEVMERFLATLQQHGYQRPRLKILPRLQLGAEAERTCGYQANERVDTSMMQGFDESQLLCHHGRMVTDRGVYVCPILLESPAARLGSHLSEALGGFRLEHGACYTCYLYGTICSNRSGTLRETSGRSSAS